MRTLIAIAALAASTTTFADTLEVFRIVDAQGRVTYTNVKPGHDDYDVLALDYDGQPKAALATAAAPIPAAPVAVVPRPPSRGARIVAAAEAPRALMVGARVLAFPSLRLAAASGEPPAVRRRKAPADPGAALRIDFQLGGWKAAAADD